MNEQCGCVLSGEYPFEITQGDNNVPLVFTLTLKSNGQGLPLNTATEITTNYLLDDGVTVLQHTLSASQLSLINGGYTGSFQDALSKAESQELNPGNGAVIITYTIGGVTKTLVLQGAINVVEPPFSVP